MASRKCVSAATASPFRTLANPIMLFASGRVRSSASARCKTFCASSTRSCRRYTLPRSANALPSSCRSATAFSSACAASARFPFAVAAAASSLSAGTNAGVAPQRFAAPADSGVTIAAHRVRASKLVIELSSCGPVLLDRLFEPRNAGGEVRALPHLGQCEIQFVLRRRRQRRRVIQNDFAAIVAVP